MSKREKSFVIVPILLFIMLAIFIQAEMTVSFENWVYNEAIEHMSPGLTLIMKVITQLGNTITVLTLCLITFLIPKLKKTIAVPISVTLIISSTLNLILKHLFSRSRPDLFQIITETGFSFPSGHAMNNAALYTMLGLLIWQYVENTPRKVVYASICVAMPLLIGYSRVYLGVHYISDVLGGWLFGFATAILIYALWDESLEVVEKVKSRRENSSPNATKS